MDPEPNPADQSREGRDGSPFLATQGPQHGLLLGVEGVQGGVLIPQNTPTQPSGRGSTHSDTGQKGVTNMD